MEHKDPETIEDLVQMVGRDIRAFVAQEKSTRGWVCAYIPLSLIALVILIPNLPDQGGIRYIALALWLASAAWCWIRSNPTAGKLPLKSPRDTIKMIRFLVKHGDLRAVGVLLILLALPPNKNAFFLMDEGLREDVVNKLADLLSQLDEENAHLLRTEERHLLCSLLASPNPRETFLYVAILKALVYVGDREAELEMERLINAPFKLYDMQAGMRGMRYGIEMHQTCHQRLKEVATECLPRLRERLKREAVGEILLRAANPLQLGPQELLRPAADTTATDPKQLLRIALDRDPDQ